MTLAGITCSAVEQAVEECDRLGRDAFLERYGFGRARRYVLLHGGRSYDSKAIVGAAHGFLPGRRPLTAASFSGGAAHTARCLRELGFTVPPSTGTRRIARDRPEAVRKALSAAAFGVTCRR